MRVALVGAEFEENLAVRYLLGALERAGHEVRPIVFNSADDTERAARELAASGTALAGFSMVFTYRARQFARLATRARELGYRGHLVAGGHFATFHAERLLGDVPAFDSVGCGEGEELLCRLAEGRAPAEVPGLVWRRGDGELVRNPAAAKEPDLDTLAWPPRKQPFDEYLGRPITNLLGSRGCLYACAFCSIAAWHKLCGGERLRLRSPAAIAEEMAALWRRGVRIFNFHDDNFFLPRPAETRARVEALRAELARRGVGKIAFAVKSRPDTVDEELYGLLVEMGLFRVFLGIEAGTARSLRQLGRGQTVEDNERALAVVNRLGLHVAFNLLLLNPDSSLEDLADNVAWLRRHPDNPMNFCRTEIYAGTPLERKLRAEGRLRGDYWGWDYEIADPRAQAAFEVVYAAFHERNYDDDGAHHLAMGVDYELRLAERFFGVSDELAQRARAFVREVNLDTCGHLEAAIDLVASGRAASASDPAARALAVRVAAANRRLGAAGDALLEELRDGAHARARRATRRWTREAAAAASLVVAFGAAGCGDKEPEQSHKTEAIAAPPPDAAPPPPPDAAPAPDGPPLTHRSEMVARPPEPELEAARKAAAAEVKRKLLPFLARTVQPPQDVLIQLVVSRDGKVMQVDVTAAGLPQDRVGRIAERVKGLKLRSGKHVLSLLVTFTAKELEKAQPEPPDTRRHEKIPPRTHPSEMAPDIPESNED